MVRIRAFRAIDDVEACNQYAIAHKEILKIFGISRITTANDSWIHNPNVYVILAEHAEDSRPLGGARIHIYSDKKEYTLPFVSAVKDFDPGVHDIVEQHAQQGTAEICGLWNAREVAGWGIGTLYLSRAGMALASQLPIHSMFVLCGEHTIGITLEKGFVIEKSLGNQGTFFYPKEGLVATAAVIEDIHDLSHAKRLDRNIIQSLREEPLQTRLETGGKISIDIEYKLQL